MQRVREPTSECGSEWLSQRLAAAVNSDAHVTRPVHASDQATARHLNRDKREEEGTVGEQRDRGVKPGSPNEAGSLVGWSEAVWYVHSYNEPRGGSSVHGEGNLGKQ